MTNAPGPSFGRYLPDRRTKPATPAVQVPVPVFSLNSQMPLSHAKRVSFSRLGLVLCGLTGAVSVAAQSTPPEAPTRLAPVLVTGQQVPGENKVLGSYSQPEWTARRRFATTRVYVQPEGQVEVELGTIFARPAEGPRTQLFRQEIEVGLPHRFQIDLENTFQDYREGEVGAGAWHRDSTAVELRYALADWDKIPLNPTVSIS